MADKKPRQRGDGGGGEPRGPSASQAARHNKDMERIRAQIEAQKKGGK